MTAIYIKWGIFQYRDREVQAKDSGYHQKLGERHGTDPPSECSEGANPVDNLIVDF